MPTTERLSPPQVLRNIAQSISKGEPQYEDDAWQLRWAARQYEILRDTDSKPSTLPASVVGSSPIPHALPADHDPTIDDPIIDRRPTSGRVARSLIELQAAHDARKREADAAKSRAEWLQRDNEALRGEVAKLREKLGWLENEQVSRDRAAHGETENYRSMLGLAWERAEAALERFERERREGE